MDRGQSDGESFNGSSCETSSEGEKSTDSFRFAVKSYRIVSHVTCENLRLPENVTINLFVDKLMENVFTDGVLLRALEKGGNYKLMLLILISSMRKKINICIK